MKYVLYNPAFNSWIAQAAGSWGRHTNDPKEAMKLPYGEWLTKCNYLIFQGKYPYTLIPFSEFE